MCQGPGSQAPPHRGGVGAWAPRNGHFPLFSLELRKIDSSEPCTAASGSQQPAHRAVCGPGLCPGAVNPNTALNFNATVNLNPKLYSLSASWVQLSAKQAQISAGGAQSDRATLQLTTVQFKRPMRGAKLPTSPMKPKLR